MSPVARGLEILNITFRLFLFSLEIPLLRLIVRWKIDNRMY